MRKTLCRLIAAMQVAVMLIGLLTVSALAEHTPNIIAFSGAEKKSCTFAESGYTGYMPSAGALCGKQHRYKRAA